MSGRAGQRQAWAGLTRGGQRVCHGRGRGRSGRGSAGREETTWGRGRGARNQNKGSAVSRAGAQQQQTQQRSAGGAEPACRDGPVLAGEPRRQIRASVHPTGQNWRGHKENGLGRCTGGTGAPSTSVS